MCVATGTERKTFGACLCLFLFFFFRLAVVLFQGSRGKDEKKQLHEKQPRMLDGALTLLYPLVLFPPSFFLSFFVSSVARVLLFLLAESKLVCTRGPTASGERELEKRANAKGARWEYQVWSSGRSPGGEDSPLSRFFFLPRARMICEHWVF